MAPDTRLFRKLRFARHKIPAWSASYQINDLRFSAIKGLNDIAPVRQDAGWSDSDFSVYALALPFTSLKR